MGGLTMTKYIECKAVFALIRPDDPNDERCAVTVATAKRLIRHALAVAPAADVAPVVHGQWISFLDGDHIMPERYYRCSRCGRVESRRQPYCNCGAKMNGGEE